MPDTNMLEAPAGAPHNNPISLLERKMSQIDLGIVYKPHPQELHELSNALTEFTGSTPVEEKLFSFAGPNEVVQIILDAASWMNILKGLALILGGKFAASFVSELGKQAAITSIDFWKDKKNYPNAIKGENSAAFFKFIEAIKSLREKNQTITIAVKLPGTPRNAGLILKTDNSSELAWQLACIALKTEQIQQLYLEIEKSENRMQKTGNNPDMSIELELMDNGDVKFLGQTLSSESTTQEKK